MKVLVVGVGVIGSYLVHALCEAGNDVTVVARGAWGDTLRKDGLVIHHHVQHATTVDHPRVVDAVPEGERFDAAFSAMRQDQQLAALGELAAVDADVLVLVGNDMRAAEVQERLAPAMRAGRLLFGFQSTAGVREGGRVECVRWGASGLDVGPLAGQPSQQDKDLLARVFTGKYRAHWSRDFGDWLTWHATCVLPMCFTSYIVGCDLRKASRELLHRMVEAQAEGYRLLLALGRQILPESDMGLFDSGPKRAAWQGFCWILARTQIGTLCVDDHCKHAPDEMRALDAGFREMRAGAPGAEMPVWDGLFKEMGGWEPVLERWGSGGGQRR